MIHINVTHNFKQVSDAMASAKRQVPFAIARALTKTAQDVKTAQQKEIEKVFDRPTRYTMNSVFMKPATKVRPEAEVWLKWGSRPEHYLLPHIKGGARPLKRFEDRMVKVGLLKASERLVPTGLAPVDAFGNIGRGAITRILSQLKTAVVVGDYSNASNSARSRKKRSGEQFFWSEGPGTTITEVRETRDARGNVTRRLVRRKQHLRRGVWMVKRTAFGNAVRPIFYAVRGVSYSQRYDFFGVSDRTVKQRFQAHWDESWAIAMKTARLSEQPRLF